MTEAEVMARTRAYVVENFLYMRKDFRFGDGDSLLTKGVIDSLGVMELVEFLSGAFGLEVDPTEITEENFGTLAGIARYVVSKGARRQPA